MTMTMAMMMMTTMMIVVVIIKIINYYYYYYYYYYGQGLHVTALIFSGTVQQTYESKHNNERKQKNVKQEE